MKNVLIPLPKRMDVQEEAAARVYPLLSRSDAPEWDEYLGTLDVCCARIFGASLTRGEGGIVLKKDPSLPAEHYRIDTGDGILLSASDEHGILYAIASLLQLITVQNGTLCVPALSLEDYPDKDYRTLMVDLAREWHPAFTVERYVDVCFFLKIKYLHLHFIDDERYTLPSRAFPAISTPNEHYTYDEIAHMNEYARSRGVILVPEFEAPGHAASLVTSYPDVFANRLTDESQGELVTEEGSVIRAENILCAGSARAVEALDVIIGEICEMFPDTPYIHIGGDEANISVWNHCEVCREYGRQNGIEDVYELYSDFIARIAQCVLNRGRTPIVWEGFPQKGAERIPKETVVIAWESHYHMAEDLLKEGFRIINGSWQPLYITPGYSTGRWSADDVYLWDVYNLQHWWEHSAATLNPVHLTPTDAVLGAQLSSWQCTYEMEIGRIMGNLAAMSERTWNLLKREDTRTFLRRLRENSLLLGRLIQDR